VKISIITATYNNIDTLDTCVMSIVNQTYTDIEHIVVDGGSSDGSQAYLEKHAKKNSNVQYSSAPDDGIYHALNKGIEMATGDIIGFLHGDDILSSNQIIERVVSQFKVSNASGVYGDLEYVSMKDLSKVVRYWKSSPFQKGLLKKGWMPAHPTLYLKKEAYLRFGNFNVTYRIAADYEFILRLFKQRELTFSYLPETIVKMRLGGTSNKNIRNILLKMKEDYKAMKRHRLSNCFWVLVLKNTSKIKQFNNKGTLG
jgi:glycosyltransferase involved in cell wall biosynthesis